MLLQSSPLANILPYTTYLKLNIWISYTTDFLVNTFWEIIYAAVQIHTDIYILKTQELVLGTVFGYFTCFDSVLW